MPPGYADSISTGIIPWLSPAPGSAGDSITPVPYAVGGAVIRSSSGPSRFSNPILACANSSISGGLSSLLVSLSGTIRKEAYFLIWVFGSEERCFGGGSQNPQHPARNYKKADPIAGLFFILYPLFNPSNHVFYMSSSQRTIIAHSGHRDLIENDLQRISDAVTEKLLKISSEQYDRFVLLTGIASGADWLAANAAAGLGMSVVLLTLSEPDENARIEQLKRQFGSRITVRPVRPAPEAQSSLAAYEALAQILAEEADHLILLWDGVDTAKAGGCSEVARKVMNMPGKEKGFRGQLHQLIVPRLSNKYPLCSNIFHDNYKFPPPGIFEWATTVFPKQSYQDRVSWANRYIMYNENFWRFLLPSFLVLFTMGLGYIGFLQLEKTLNGNGAGPVAANARLDAFFNAANLITLNASALNVTEKVPLMLNIARFTGLLFILNAFIVAFMLAIGSNNKNLIRFFLWKLAGYHNIHLVIGLNSLSYPLAIALKQQGAKIIVVDKDPDPNLKTEASKRGVRVMNGSAHSAAFLKRIGAHRARNTYILETEDMENIRTLHELDQLWAQFPDTEKQCYVQLKTSRAAEFIGRPGRLSSHVNVRRFNFHETISRKLLIRYPADRFRPGSHSGAEILLFGFGEMGRQLLLSLLQVLQPDASRRINITVFCKDAAAEKDSFFQQYPCLWHDAVHNPLYEKSYAKKIRALIFPEDMVVFKELPLSDALYFNDTSLVRALSGNCAATFYFCLEEAALNAAYLHGLLGKIGQRDLDLQLFCYFNLPGEKETDHVAYILNNQIPHTPVILFGRMEEECRALAAEDFTIDDLAALINYWYAYKTPAREWIAKPRTVIRLAREDWKVLPYAHQESSRQAADHIWPKLRHIGVSPDQLRRSLADSDKRKQLLAEAAESDNEKYLQLSRMEQRRWCAEKLLSGFLPLQDVYPDSIENIRGWISKWNDPDDPGFKKKYQSQKLHIDLVPFDELFDGVINIRGSARAHSEKNKDSAQIEGIPYFLYVLFNSK